MKKILYNLYKKYKRNPYDNINFKSRGKNVSIGENFHYSGEENIKIGNDTSIGLNNIFFATLAELNIGKYVVFAPNVMIVTGDHRTDIIGEYMRNITNDMKLPQNDLPVNIKDDVWIGANVTILKGVTIGEGSIIAAGNVIYKDIPDYTVYISKDLQKPRFTQKQIIEHKKLLQEKYN